MFCAACGGQGDDEPCACGNDRALAGRYHIVRPLGPLPRGGSPWALLRVEDQAELVGTEVLVPTSAADSAACALRADSLRELGPGLPQVVDHTISGIGRTRSLWLITEPVPGLVPRGPQPEEVVLGWVDDLCRVLGALHARGRTHGRVASAARIGPDGAVLADLGAAWDELGGCPSADAGAAPEQLGGRTDARTDLYGLAAAALGWLTGAEPSVLRSPDGPIRWRGRAEVSPGAARAEVRARIHSIRHPPPPPPASEVRPVEIVGQLPGWSPAGVLGSLFVTVGLAAASVGGATYAAWAQLQAPTPGERSLAACRAWRAAYDHLPCAPAAQGAEGHRPDVDACPTFPDTCDATSYYACLTAHTTCVDGRPIVEEISCLTGSCP